MVQTTGDTIVAVSSPPGRSLRGLVRLTGPDAIALLRGCFVAEAITPRRLLRGRLTSPIEIPVLACCFEGPASYTGEDMAEIQCPGNPALLEMILHYFMDEGARLAEGGEFTYRAYTAGKIDLTQAEGVMATIAASSDSQLRAAAQLREGNLGKFSQGAVDRLSLQLALVEAGIDFVDQEDVVPIGPIALRDNLKVILGELKDLQANSKSWGALEALPRVVFVGKPSAGKSTLFNKLLGHERAVICEMPGTTRDVLYEPWHIDLASGQVLEVMLADIAGLGYTETLIDEQAQLAGKRAIDEADVLLAIHDQMFDAKLLEGLPAEARVINVISKADLLDDEQKKAGQTQGHLYLSSVTGLGLDELTQVVAEALSGQVESATSQKLALQPRHERALQAATEAIEDAVMQLDEMQGQRGLTDVELIASCLRFGLDELAMLGGQMTPDDVIGKVFSSFCVGK